MEYQKRYIYIYRYTKYVKIYTQYFNSLYYSLGKILDILMS